VPVKRSGSWQPKMLCSLDTGPLPLSRHPVNERTAKKALTATGKATSRNPTRATSIATDGDAVHALKDPTLAEDLLEARGYRELSGHVIEHTDAAVAVLRLAAHAHDGHTPKRMASGTGRGLAFTRGACARTRERTAPPSCTTAP
jgi:hypothetical protein